MKALIVREFPDAQIPFLRFQTGVEEFRPEMAPVYPDLTTEKVSHEAPVADRWQPVFWLLGFGETRQKAIDAGELARLA